MTPAPDLTRQTPLRRLARGAFAGLATGHLALAVLGGLLLSGIIHIAVILMIPDFATRDAYTALGRLGAEGAFHPVPASGAEARDHPDLDPRFAHAACRFSLRDGPVRIRSRMYEDFWSIAVFDRRGANLYSLNDRTAERADIDLVVATPLQMTRLRQTPPPELERSIIVELPIETGFVLIRAFVADPTLAPTVAGALAAASCGGVQGG